MKNLTQEDTAFILWCLGFIYDLSDKFDKGHKEHVKENLARTLPKIIQIHEE